MQTPLTCFGLENDPLDSRCVICPHKTECLKFMGLRAGKITLDKLRFEIAPKKLSEHWKEHPITYDDPEAPMLLSLYRDCYMTVFSKYPPTADNPHQVKEDIVRHARAAGCSVRLFILANMVAQAVHEEIIQKHTEKARPTRFHASLLKGKRALTRAEKYAQACKDRFGTFSVSSLATLQSKEMERDEVQSQMLNSEITAGQFVVRHKIHHGGPPFEALYAETEFHLHPNWLAIEPSYKTTILDPYLKNRTGDESLKDHRFSVCQVIGKLKRSFAYQTLMFKRREQIMPEAVRRVLSYFDVRPQDFVCEAKAVTSPMDFWIHLGRTLQQYHCWLLLQGEPSYFKRRAAKEMPVCS